MDLGTFSLSLAVQDIRASRLFYEALGFEAIDDHESERWIILKNGQTLIGLFQGMFEHNILTFHPQDVRSIQKHLKEKGIPLMQEADEHTTGPAHIILKDPDGNEILMDQF